MDDLNGQASVPDDDHQRFLQHLRESEPARWAVAQWLSKRGYSVQLPPMKEAETRDKWKECVDDGDLFVTMRVEAKQLSYDFTCREDWPFKEFMLVSKKAFDRAKPKPHGFVILNRAGTHAAFVLSSGSKDWYVSKRRDSRYQNVIQESYFAPLDSVIFAPFAEPKSSNNK